jgi:hypothetical protein
MITVMYVQWSDFKPLGIHSTAQRAWPPKGHTLVSSKLCTALAISAATFSHRSVDAEALTTYMYGPCRTHEVM